MGFDDEVAAVTALKRAYGNVSGAIDILEREQASGGSSSTTLSGSGQARAAATPTLPRVSVEGSPYRNQVLRLEEMGFSDRAKSLQVLQQTNGNVEQAVERLLGGSTSSEAPAPSSRPSPSAQQPRQQPVQQSRPTQQQQQQSMPRPVPQQQRQQQQPQQQSTSFVNDLIGSCAILFFNHWETSSHITTSSDRSRFQHSRRPTTTIESNLRTATIPTPSAATTTATTRVWCRRRPVSVDRGIHGDFSRRLRRASHGSEPWWLWTNNGNDGVRHESWWLLNNADGDGNGNGDEHGNELRHGNHGNENGRRNERWNRIWTVCGSGTGERGWRLEFGGSNLFRVGCAGSDRRLECSGVEL